MKGIDLFLRKEKTFEDLKKLFEDHFFDKFVRETEKSLSSNVITKEELSELKKMQCSNAFFAKDVMLGLRNFLLIGKYVKSIGYEIDKSFDPLLAAPTMFEDNINSIEMSLNDFTFYHSIRYIDQTLEDIVKIINEPVVDQELFNKAMNDVRIIMKLKSKMRVFAEDLLEDVI